jgi:hypothetical protein
VSERTRHIVLGLALVALAAGATALTLVLTRGGGAAPSRAEPVAMHDPLSTSSLRARFAVLSHKHSNRCGMPASALESMPPGADLQGSCCFPMDYQSYVNQVRVLSRRSKRVDLIPKDPYDIPVRLAKRLIGYQSIELTPAQQRTYDRAKPLSETKGPCCCPCWRWDAFEGQAKFLISRRHYSARQIAAVWSAEEGCGGPSHRNA